MSDDGLRSPPGAGRRALLRWAPLLVGLAVLGFHVSPLWRDVHSWAAWWDARYFWFVIEVDRATILQHHQFPLWDPYYCGGAPHFANPQSATLSPLTPLLLLVGTSIGYRLGYTIGLLAALLSLRAYARTLGLSDVASAVAGTGYAICGALAQHMGGGHWSWMGFALHPLLLRSVHLVVAGRREHVVWGGLALAAIILHVPVYPFAFGLVVLGTYALLVGLGNGVRDRRRLLGALAAAAGIAAVGVGLGAVRLLPMGEFIAAHPRKVKDWDYTWPWELFETYALRHTERGFGYHHQYVFPEYGNYFGVVGFALMLAGAYVVVRHRRALWPVPAAALLFVLFQLGHLIPLPWWALKKLPVYENLRVPSRFTVVVGMFMCVLIGVAVDRWGAPALARWRELPRRGRRLGAAVLLLALAYLVDAAEFNRRQFEPTLGGPLPNETPAAEFHQTPGDRGRMLYFPRANVGTLNCVEEIPVSVSPRLSGGLPADEYLAEPDAGSLHRLRWSPNRIVLDVDVHRPVTVLVNQNFGPGWHAQGGTLLDDGGLLAARVDAGHRTLTFYYRPRSFVVGAAISIATLASSAAFVVVVSVRRRRRAPARPAGDA